MKFDGGPAFPLSVEHLGIAEMEKQPPTGMSLRDYFAEGAMRVEIETACRSMKNVEALARAAEDAHMTVEQRIAHNAYRMADAMLAEREKK